MVTAAAEQSSGAATAVSTPMTQCRGSNGPDRVGVEPGGKIHTLTFTTLFPNREQPVHGVFVMNRLRHLLRSEQVSTQVLAPVAWFPFAHERFGAYAKFARIPPYENFQGLNVYHPRFLLIPKVGMSAAPLALAAGALPTARRLLDQGIQFDLIDAHYFYPDGVAAVMIGQVLRKPVVITGRGTDLSLIPQFSLPRRQIQWAARRAAGLVTVCQALKDALVEVGVDPARIEVLRNGVDLEIFSPVDRRVAQATLGITRPAIGSIGGLIERKGHHLAISAMAQLPEFDLFIVGDGPMRQQLEDLARNLGVADRVHFLGHIPHQQLATFYSAMDIVVLASSREGWANVLLEAMACGTPVVASKIWGTPEVVSAPDAGQLMNELSPAGVAEGVRTLMARGIDRSATAAFAARFTWDETTLGQLRLFRRILEAQRANANHS